MSDFEDILKVVVVMVAAIGIPVALYVGYRYAMMWLRRYEQEGNALHGADADTAARLVRLEQDVAELQERLDFTERVLARPESAELPRGGAA